MKIKLNLILLITALTLLSCDSGNKNKSMSDLVTHFNANGFNGDSRAKGFALIGAIDGIGYSGDDFNLEVYKYEDSKNIPDRLTYKNEHFGMIIHKVPQEKKDKLIETFMSFGSNSNDTVKNETQEKTIVSKKENNKTSINKEFITLNSIQIGDNIKEHTNFSLSKEQDNFFDIYINNQKTTINKLEGNLMLFVSNSIIEKIQFDSGATFMGSTSLARTAFNGMLEERKEWVRDAMLNYSIAEWDDSKTISEYVKKDFLHQYNLESINALGQQLGWKMSYVITSRDAQLKEKQGRKNNLDFGSTKTESKTNKEIEKNDISKSSSQFNNKEISSKKKLIINVDNLRVRVSPDLNSDKIENLPINTEVQYLDEKSDEKTIVKINDKDINDNWYKIKTPNGNIGWIHGCCFGNEKVDITNKIFGHYPQASKRLLTLKDITNYNSNQLMLMRNEIFARYGHKFNEGGRMDKYFQTQSWYVSKNIDATDLLTEIEKQNIALIKTRE